ncbi:LEA type 2 family protein [Tenacibaculum salmonis]|uniref:LEA type 2 family protein n=1 Tax=Tenacibaculum sp. P3-BQ1 TaxID=3232310 RepID=UPI0034DEF9D7
MKKLLFFIISLSIVSCSVKKKPIFLKVDDIKVMSVASDTIRLKANAFFKNPNDIGGKLATDEIKVIVNGTQLAQVSSEEFKVPARNEFSIPLNVAIPAKKVFENNKNGILGGLLNSLLNKSVKVQFKGDLRYKVLGFSHVYTIDKTEDIKIKF